MFRGDPELAKSIIETAADRAFKFSFSGSFDTDWNARTHQRAASLFMVAAKEVAEHLLLNFVSRGNSGYILGNPTKDDWKASLLAAQKVFDNLNPSFKMRRRRMKAFSEQFRDEVFREFDKHRGLI